MSSIPLVSSAAVGRPVAIAASAWPTLVFNRLSAMPKLAGVTPASRLEVRPTPQMVSSGVREIDTLDWRTSAWMPDRDLRAGLVRPHQCIVGRLGGSDPTAGSVCSGGHQRCFQSSIGRVGRGEF